MAIQVVNAVDACSSIRAWTDQGFEVVPIVGAGISVASGIPATPGLIEYMAYADHYWGDHVSYVSRKQPLPPRSWHDPAFELCQLKEMRRATLGWPDPFRLRSDLLQAANDGGDSLSKIEDAFRAAGLRRFDKDAIENVETLVKALKDWKDDGTLFERLKQTVLLPDSDDGRKLLSLLETTPNRLGFQGEWKEFLNYASNGRPAEIDAFFGRITASALPCDIHRFIAFFVRLLDAELVVTPNFDPLLERAMRHEGLSPEVFDVDRNRRFPERGRLRGKQAILKLHGSTHGLIAGDNVNEVLDDGDRRRLDESLPPRPLFFVLGWGGNDRRIQDMLLTRLIKAKPARMLWTSVSNYRLAKQGEAPSFLNRIDAESDPSNVCQFHQIAALDDFLQQLYCHLTGVHPATAATYRPMRQRPLLAEKGADEKHLTLGAVNVFLPASGDAVSWNIADATERWADDADDAISKRLRPYERTHSIIWIDASRLSTVQAFVERVLERLRDIDPTLPPAFIPSSDKAEPLTELLLNGLCRVRAILVVVRTGSFLQGRHSHHGVADELEAKDIDEYKNLTRLLVRLANRLPTSVFESAVCLSVDDAAPRRTKQDAATLHAVERISQGFLEDLKFSAIDTIAVPEREPPSPPSGGNEKPSLAFLSIFRGPVTPVIFQAVARRTGKERDPNERAREVLDALQGTVKVLSGGHVVLKPSVRNGLYEAMSDGVDSQTISRSPAAAAEALAKKALLLFLVHDAASIVYYNMVFMPTNDFDAFAEYAYHRTSSCRYLAATIASFIRADKSPKIGGDFDSFVALLDDDAKSMLELNAIDRRARSLFLLLKTKEHDLIQGLQVALKDRLRTLVTAFSHYMRRSSNLAAPNELLHLARTIRRRDVKRFRPSHYLGGNTDYDESSRRQLDHVSLDDVSLDDVSLDDVSLFSWAVEEQARHDLGLSGEIAADWFDGHGKIPKWERNPRIPSELVDRLGHIFATSLKADGYRNLKGDAVRHWWAAAGVAGVSVLQEHLRPDRPIETAACEVLGVLSLGLRNLHRRPSHELFANEQRLKIACVVADRWLDRLTYLYLKERQLTMQAGERRRRQKAEIDQHFAAIETSLAQCRGQCSMGSLPSRDVYCERLSRILSVLGRCRMLQAVYATLFEDGEAKCGQGLYFKAFRRLDAALVGLADRRAAQRRVYISRTMTFAELVLNRTWTQLSCLFGRELEYTRRLGRKPRPPGDRARGEEFLIIAQAGASRVRRAVQRIENRLERTRVGIRTWWSFKELSLRVHALGALACASELASVAADAAANGGPADELRLAQGYGDLLGAMREMLDCLHSLKMLENASNESRLGILTWNDWLEFAEQVVIAASVPRFLLNWPVKWKRLGDEHKSPDADWDLRLSQTAAAMNQRIKHLLRTVGINDGWQDGRFIENWQTWFFACGFFKPHFRDARSPFGVFIKQRWKGWSPDPVTKLKPRNN
jgi:hypothetical protein